MFLDGFSIRADGLSFRPCFEHSDLNSEAKEQEQCRLYQQKQNEQA